MSKPRGPLRKVFDISPTAITSNGNYNGSGTPTTVWASGVTSPVWLSNIAESVADNGRVGITVAVQDLQLRVKINPGVTNTEALYHVRMLVFSDQQCDGTLPSVSDILGDSNATSYTISNGLEMAFLQPAYFGRFKIIEDKNWTWWNAGTTNGVMTSDGNHSFFHQKYYDMKGHRLMWDTTDAADIAAARNGHLFMFFLFSETVTSAGGLPVTTSTDPPGIQYTVRLRYGDA